MDEKKVEEKVEEVKVEDEVVESRDAWVSRATIDILAASIAFKTTVNELLNDIADVKNKIME